MGQTWTVDEMISCVKEMDIKDEIRLLNTITKNLEERLFANDERSFWLSLSEKSLENIWNNEEDEVYNDLLKG